MKKAMKILIILLAVVIMIMGVLLAVVNSYLGPTSSDNTIKTITITSGSTFSDIADVLIENKLIKNKKIFLLYLKLNKVENIYAATYSLSEDMGINKIVKNLISGGQNTSEISITFREGLNYRQIATIISKNTNNSYDDVINVLKDTNFIDSMIDKYWFLTDSIKNKDIYYSLEGYLFPETYRFNSKDVTVNEIISKMLNHTNTILNKYKEILDESNYSVHQMLTLASIVELEGASSNDRAKVAGVFYNRLNSNWTLGSDVTGYYGAKMDDWTNGLGEHLSDCNGYNTRGSCVAGLPIGPIANPGIDSIEATLNPEEHKYYYFVADCDGVTYLTKTEREHNAMVSKLRKEGKWCDR